MTAWFTHVWAGSVDKAGIVPTLAAIVAIISALAVALFRLGRAPTRWLHERIWIPFREAQSRIPKRTLTVLPGDSGNTFWAEAQFGNKNGMQIRVWLHLSNLTQKPLQLNKVWLYYRRWGVFSQRREGQILTRYPSGDEFGHYAILPDHMSEAIATWMLPERFQEPGKSFVGRVGVIDQFGNERRSEKIKVCHVRDTSRFH